MKIVTLTSDLGLTDHYVATLKGALLSQIGDLSIVDISHDVQSFNIAQAAFYVNNCFNDFPKGTVHFIDVDSTPQISIGNPDHNMYPIIMMLSGHYFVGCDNGFFSLINGYQQAEKIVRIDSFLDGGILKSAAKSIYIPAIKKILNGESLEAIGEEMHGVRQAFTTQPTLETNLIKGTVIHVDKFGNVIVNITADIFQKSGKGNAFTIYFKNSQYFIEQISDYYSDVPTGEKLAMFNDNGFLEIAINKGTVGSGGGASSLLGLNVKDMVRIEFHPKGSKNRIEDLFN